MLLSCKHTLLVWKTPAEFLKSRQNKDALDFFLFIYLSVFFLLQLWVGLWGSEAAFSLNLLVPLTAGIPSSVSSLYRIFSLSISRSNSWSKKKGIPQFLMQSKLIDKCCEYVLLWLAACCFSSFSLCYFTYFGTYIHSITNQWKSYDALRSFDIAESLLDFFKCCRKW